VLLQALLLPTLGVLRQANLYTGLRQLLFAAPALAVLVAVAIATLVAVGTRRWVPWVAAAALVLPVLAQLQLFPYGYAYRSPVALVGAPVVVERDPSWELPTDYWRTSVRELAPAVPSVGAVTCSPSRDADGGFRPYSHESHDDCARDPVGPRSRRRALGRRRRQGGRPRLRRAGARRARPTRRRAAHRRPAVGAGRHR
jgi:hypothetical protein